MVTLAERYVEWIVGVLQVALTDLPDEYMRHYDPARWVSRGNPVLAEARRIYCRSQGNN